MLKNHLKIALRHLLRHKEYSLINILGLATGIACCVLIMLFVKSELSYDRFHEKAPRLYRAWQNEVYEGQNFTSAITPLPLAPAFKETYPEVEATCRIYAFSAMVKVNQTSFSDDLRMVDPSFFQMFSFHLVNGNQQQPFPTANSIVLSESTAKKYFGSSSAIGKTIELQLQNDKVPFTVAGVVANAPEASSIKFNALIPFANSRHLLNERYERNWFNIFVETYVLLHKNVKASGLETRFAGLLKQQLGNDYKEGRFTLHLQPITAVHLDSSLQGIEPVSQPKYAYILGTIGLLILLVACINFITLSIGRSSSRALEVGVRKTLGADHTQLIRQFWGEALLLTLVSVILGVALASVLTKPFDQVINRQLAIGWDLYFFLFCLGLVVIIGIVAGIYPAIILSGFKPVEVLKGKLKLKSHSGWLRQGLVVGQFTASIAMIVCTILIGQQMHLMKSMDLGYKKDQVVVIPTNKGRKEGTELGKNFRTALMKYPQVANISISLYSLAETPWINLGFTDDKKVFHSFQFNSIDTSFIPMMGISLAAGRNFQSNNPADNTESAIVNEAFLKEFNIKDPIGKKLPGRMEQRIVGVVKDFNFESLHTKVAPLLMTIQPDSVYRRIESISIAAAPQPRVSVRMREGSLTDNIALLKQVWHSVAPDQDFEYRFLDDTIAAQYEQEQRTQTIIRWSSFFSIFIACMGLFGLATLSVVRRTKEIGIRKVLGASVVSITTLLSKDFLRLVIIAAVIAFPLAWWAMTSWLKDFAYRIPLQAWAFIAAAAGAALVALITISFQAIKAALMNPVKSLRTE